MNNKHFHTILDISDQSIIDSVGTSAVLEQCAEECSELAQACLKMSRKKRGENPTPKTIEDISEDLTEEIADVLLSIEYVMRSCNVDLGTVIPIIADKQYRWTKRINEKEGEN